MWDTGGGGAVVRVTPADLCTLADQLMVVSQDLTQGWLSAEPELSALSGGAAGDTPHGGGLVTAHTGVVAAAGVALGRLAAVLEQDMDDLYVTALDLQATDGSSAGRFGGGPR